MTADTSPRVDIYLDTHGDAESATLRLPELTECEAACVGQPLDAMLHARHCRCEVSALSHRVAAAKAVDAAYRVVRRRPPRKNSARCCAPRATSPTSPRTSR